MFNIGYETSKISNEEVNLGYIFAGRMRIRTTGNGQIMFEKEFKTDVFFS